MYTLSLLRYYLSLSSNISEKWTTALGFTSKEKKKNSDPSHWPCHSSQPASLFPEPEFSQVTYHQIQIILWHRLLQLNAKRVTHICISRNLRQQNSHHIFLLLFPFLSSGWTFWHTLTGFSLIGQMVKNLPAVREIQVWPLGQEDSPEEGNGYSLQSSCLGNPMDREAWGGGPHSVGWQRVSHGWETNTN